MLYVEYFFVLCKLEIRGIEDSLGARGRRPVKCQGWKGGGRQNRVNCITVEGRFQHRL